MIKLNYKYIKKNILIKNILIKNIILLIKNNIFFIYFIISNIFSNFFFKIGKIYCLWKDADINCGTFEFLE